MIKVTFADFDGHNPKTFEAEPGDSLLRVAHWNDVEIEGACEGNMACSTCHVIVDESWFGKLAEASEEEDEMLDLAPDLSPTSRLGCQIVLDESMDGLVVRLPRSTLNASGW